MSHLASIFYVFEFGDDDFMSSTLISSLQFKLSSNYKLFIIRGKFKYKFRGGFHYSRILNYLYISIIFFIKLILKRPKYVIVRSTPPGIQIYVGLLCSVFRIKCVCWMMDYHPQIEIDFLDRKKLKLFSTILKIVNKISLNKFNLIIVLDLAMKNRIEKIIYDNSKIIIHPVWQKITSSNYPIRHNKINSELNIVYIGNFGKSHNVDSLEYFFKNASKQISINLYSIGTNTIGINKFLKIANTTNIKYKSFSFIESDNDLNQIIIDLDINLGLVLLSEKMSGLVSPSKFLNYLNFKLPILYFGPQNTMSHYICENFNSGFCFPTNYDKSTKDLFIEKTQIIIHKKNIFLKQNNIEETMNWFKNYNSTTLANLIFQKIN
jgi:hypothetical protein